MTMRKRGTSPAVLIALLIFVLVPWSGVAAEGRERGAVPAPGPTAPGRPTVGIALGAGGANGLAHILMLEALDEMEITPCAIAGSSIGAVIGALYASGMTAAEIRELAEKFSLPSDDSLKARLLYEDALRWMDLLEVDLGRGGLLSSEGVISLLYDSLESETFEALKIPLKIVAADLWSRRQVVLSSGALLPAIKASMALPGVFEPEVHGDRVLVDGGTVNPVPYDLLTGECDIVVAVDVIGVRTASEDRRPSYFETIFNSVKVMQHAIMTEKRRREDSTIYLVPRIVDVRALEFYRTEEIFSQAGPAKEDLKRRLGRALAAW